MNWQRKFAIATLLTISLIGGDGNFSFAAAGSHYPLWVCGGRYGGWGWSRPASPFSGLSLDALVGALANPQGYGYRRPAYSYVSSYYAYTYPYCFVSYIDGSDFSPQLKRSRAN
ncbi:MAG TPA: hypothetical protein VIF02_06985 [Methylocella sp.]